MSRTWIDLSWAAVLGMIVVSARTPAQDGDGPPPGPSEQVHVAKLLGELADLDALTRRPDPAYELLAYSTRRGGKEGPFGFYAREKRGMRIERVMARHEGPGAVVRIWVGEPHGTLRVYLDGAAAPAIEMETKLLVTGQINLFPPPFTGTAGHGGYLRFPIPYAKSMKVTCDEGGFAFQVETRAYAKKTTVATFVAKEAVIAMFTAQEALGRLQAALAKSPDDREAGVGVVLPRPTVEVNLKPAGAQILLERSVEAPEAVTRFAVEDLTPFLGLEVMRHLRLEATFDGHRTIDVSLADLFCMPGTFAAFRCLPMRAEPLLDGVLRRRVCKLPMPYRRSVRLTLRNTAAAPVHGLRVFVETAPYAWDASSLHLHAGSAQAKGRGTVVGQILRARDALEPDVLARYDAASAAAFAHPFGLVGKGMLARFRLLSRIPVGEDTAPDSGPTPVVISYRAPPR